MQKVAQCRKLHYHCPMNTNTTTMKNELTAKEMTALQLIAMTADAETGGAATRLHNVQTVAQHLFTNDSLRGVIGSLVKKQFIHCSEGIEGAHEIYVADKLENAGYSDFAGVVEFLQA